MPDEPAKLDETLDAPAYRPPEKPAVSRRWRRLLLVGGAILALSAVSVTAYLVLRPSRWKYRSSSVVAGVPEPVVKCVACILHDNEGWCMRQLERDYPGLSEMISSPQPKIERAFRRWLATGGPWEKDNWQLAEGALYLFGDNDLPLNRSFLKHEDDGVRSVAYSHLVRETATLPSSQAEHVELLRSMSADKSQHVRLHALELIWDCTRRTSEVAQTGNSGTETARFAYVELAMPMLGESFPQIRRTAATVLGILGDPRAIEPLNALLKEKDVDGYTRTVVENSLLKLRSVGAQDKVDDVEAKRKAQDEAAGDEKREERGLK